MSNVKQIVNEIHVAFQELNKTFFNNELPEPALTVQSGGKRKSMGWCTTKEIWTDREGKIKKYEINISAEYLDLSFTETMDTLMHEMVHLYNLVNNIQDCSRNGTYHNKRFKVECERRGFFFETDKPDKRYGFAFPKLTQETIKRIEELNIDKSVFSIARRTGGYAENGNAETEEEGEKKKTSFKWTCPTCGIILRSTKEDVYVICGKCDEELVLNDL